MTGYIALSVALASGLSSLVTLWQRPRVQAKSGTASSLGTS